MFLTDFYIRCAHFCRSELGLSLLGGFAIGALLVTVGAFDGEAEIPVAAPVTLISSAT